jgi:hypothetical protein
MRGYRVEEWNQKQIEKNFALPLRSDFEFKIVKKAPPYFETMVSTSLPVFLADASGCRPDHKDKLSVLVGSIKRLAVATPNLPNRTMRKILRFQRRYIFPDFKPLETLENVNTLDWINNVNQSERRKNELREAFDVLQKEGLVQSQVMDLEWSNPVVADSFIKDESYDEEKALRWINSSLDTVKVVFGPKADACMHVLVEHPDFIKTVPVRERAKVIFNDLGGIESVVQSTDATSMEDHYAFQPGPAPHAPMHLISNDFMLHLCGSLPVPLDLKKSLFHVFQKTTPCTPLSWLCGMLLMTLSNYVLSFQISLMDIGN